MKTYTLDGGNAASRNYENMRRYVGKPATIEIEDPDGEKCVLEIKLLSPSELPEIFKVFRLLSLDKEHPEKIFESMSNPETVNTIERFIKQILVKSTFDHDNVFNAEAAKVLDEFISRNFFVLMFKLIEVHTGMMGQGDVPTGATDPRILEKLQNMGKPKE